MVGLRKEAGGDYNMTTITLNALSKDGAER